MTIIDYHYHNHPNITFWIFWIWKPRNWGRWSTTPRSGRKAVAFVRGTKFTAKMSGGFLSNGSSRPRNWTVKLLLNKSVSEPRTPTAYDVGASFCHGNAFYGIFILNLLNMSTLELVHLKDEHGDFMKKTVDQKEVMYLEWIKQQLDIIGLLTFKTISLR